MISFSNISKQYGRQLIFVDMCFQLNPGEKVGLVGPNGSGKTTLFRMVVGEEDPGGSPGGSRGRSPRFPTCGTFSRLVCALDAAEVFWAVMDIPAESERPAVAPDYSPEGVDRSLIRWMLSLSPAQRLRFLEDRINDLAEIRKRNAGT